MPVSGHDFDVKLIAACAGDCVHRGHQGCKMNHRSIRFGCAEFAVEVPIVHVRRQGPAALTFDVLADVMLGGIEQAIPVLAFDVE